MSLITRHCFLLDSCPDRAHSSVKDVICVVSSIPVPLRSKNDLVQILTSEKQIPTKPIASWMTTNLKKVPTSNGNGFHFMFDLDVVHGILHDFSKQDMMKLIRDCCLAHNGNTTGDGDHKTNATIHQIVAKRNDAWTDDILQKLEDIQQDSSSSSSSLNIVKLDAGHWVHMDDLDGLMKALIRAF